MEDGVNAERTWPVVRRNARAAVPARALRGMLIAVVWALAVAVSAGAQEGTTENLGAFYSYGDNYFLEVTTLPGTPAKGRALVTFRLSYDLLTFRKTSQPYQRGALYMATPTLYMEAIGSDGVIVDRGSWHDTARVQEYAWTNAKNEFICGAVSLALRPGMYTIKYTFDDGTPGNGFTQSTGAFPMDDFYAAASPALGTPVFIRSATADTLNPTAIDASALFGHRLRAFVPIAAPSPPSELQYEVLPVPRKGESAPRPLRTGNGTLLGHVGVDRIAERRDSLRLVLTHMPADTGRVYGALIDCSTDDINVGDYMLALTCKAGQNFVTDTVRFRVRWVDMPFSLIKADYAIKTLYPIANDEMIDEMLAGNKDGQRKAVNKFWDARDPTPTTRYNEAMAEYYRRVDYAYFNFKSIGLADGAFTDRGKIYMLYGPPTQTTRDLGPSSAPHEVWIYRNVVNRRFVFVDESRSGDYRLVEYNDL